MSRTDVLCIGSSWDRPGAHRELLVRCSRARRVFFVERPDELASHPYLDFRQEAPMLYVVKPRLRCQSSDEQRQLQLRGLLQLLALDFHVVRPILWYMRCDGMVPPGGLTVSLTVCGPFDHDEPNVETRRTMFEQADLLFTDVTLGGDPAPTLTQAFWDETWSAMAAVIDQLTASGSLERRLVPRAHA